MAQVELIMPKMGESVHEATIIKWLKNEGDKVALDEPVLEIATDKVDSEIPSTAEGTLTKKLFNEGDVVQVGKAIAVISSSSSAVVSSSPSIDPIAIKPVDISPSKNGEHIPVPVLESASAGKTSSSGKFFSPLVRNIARQEGISASELETISGTGKDGRVTKHDILAYIPNRGKKISQPGTEKKVSAQIGRA